MRARSAGEEILIDSPAGSVSNRGTTVPREGYGLRGWDSARRNLISLASIMTKEDDYRQNAAQTIELASRAENRADKGHLLALAEKWLDLADRAHRLTKRFGVKHRNHPLVDAKLGRERNQAE